MQRRGWYSRSAMMLTPTKVVGHTKRSPGTGRAVSRSAPACVGPREKGQSAARGPSDRTLNRPLSTIETRSSRTGDGEGLMRVVTVTPPKRATSRGLPYAWSSGSRLLACGSTPGTLRSCTGCRRRGLRARRWRDRGVKSCCLPTGSTNTTAKTTEILRLGVRGDVRARPPQPSRLAGPRTIAPGLRVRPELEKPDEGHCATKAHCAYRPRWQGRALPRARAERHGSLLKARAANTLRSLGPRHGSALRGESSGRALSASPRPRAVSTEALRPSTIANPLAVAVLATAPAWIGEHPPLQDLPFHIATSASSTTMATPPTGSPTSYQLYAARDRVPLLRPRRRPRPRHGCQGSERRDGMPLPRGHAARDARAACAR